MSEETGGAEVAPISATQAAGIEPAQPASVAPVGDPAPVDPSVPAPVEATTELDSDPAAIESEVAPFDPETPIPLEVNLGQFSGGEEELSEVNIVVPPEHAQLLTEAGLDPVKVATELWSGEFGLSDETKQVLYDKYGKVSIDIALEGIKAAAHMQYFQSQQQAAAKQQADDAAWASTLELLGGAEEGEKAWEAMDTFARKNFSEQEMQAFNDVMDSGNPYMQRLAITDLKSRVDNGVLNLLEGGAGSGSSSAAGYLTGEEFSQLMISGEYHKDPAKYDAMRRRGVAKGF